MSLAYGVLGEIDLIVENNYGDFYNWSAAELMATIDKAIRYTIEFTADDPKEIKELKAILKSTERKKAIAKSFIRDHKEGIKLKVGDIK